MHLRSQLQHRMSFLFVSLGHAAFTTTSFVTIYLLMSSTQEILGFTRDEVIIAGAVINIAYSTAECFVRGFDTFPTLLSNGKYDRILVQPQNEIYQIIMSTMDFTRIGRFIVALVLLLVSISRVTLHYAWLLPVMILCGVFVYGCLFVIYGAVSFYTTESLEIFNIFTDGTREFGKVPYSFYGKSIFSFLTYILPLALIQYYPLCIILGKDVPWYYAIYPLFSLFFVVPTGIIWKHAQKHYRSMGS